MLARVESFNPETKKFLVQPFNALGDKDGKALEEVPQDVWLLPEPGSEVVLGGNKKSDEEEVLRVGNYILPAHSVQFTHSGSSRSRGACCLL